MYRKNTAGQFACFQMLLTATGAVATGLSPAIRRCIDGTFAAGGGTVTEDSAGFYKYAMAQADTNGNDISLMFSGATAMPVCINFVTTAADPTNAATFGITDIDATISSRMATYTQPTGFLAATFPSGTIANTTNLTAGTVATVTNQLTAAQIATGVWQDTTAGDFTTASSIGKSLYNAFTANTSVYTVAALANAPSGTGASAATIATAVWQDTTAGDFTTAGSIGKSLFTSGNAPGAASGLALVGSNMGTASSVTGSVGSVTGSVGSVTSGVTVTTNNDKTGYTASTVSDKTGYALTSGERDNIANDVLDIAAGVETGWTVRQALRIMLSALSGKASGLATTSVAYRDMADSKNRITATVDSNGNRTTVTRDAT